MWIVWFAPQTPAKLSGTMGIARYVPQPASLITFAGEDQSGTSPPMPSKIKSSRPWEQQRPGA